MGQKLTPGGLIVSSDVETSGDVMGRLEAEVRSLQEAVVTSEADRKMVQRRLEDLAWGSMDARGTDDLPNRTRSEIRKRALRYWQEDPVIGGAVDLLTRYSVGRGVPMPDIPSPPHEAEEDAHKQDGHWRGDPKDAEAKAERQARAEGRMSPAAIRSHNENKRLGEASRPALDVIGDDDIIRADEITQEQHDEATAVLERFWEAAENQAVLTSAQAQREKSAELQIDGEWFFAIYPGEGDEPTLLVDIDPSEIVDVIPRSGNARVDVWYRREQTPMVYDFKSGNYIPDPKANGEKKVTYYRHWRNEPDPGDETPPENQIDNECVIYHVAINKLSRQKRGNSELRRVLEWSRGFSEYMTSRMSVARAVNRIAQQVTVDGGPTDVARVMRALSAGDSLSMQRVPQTGGETAGLPEAKTLVTSTGVKVEPSNFETGSSVASTDKKAFLGQIAVGTGWPMHYLGDEGAASLSTLVSMEQPVFKMIEDRQELWSSVISDLSLIALRAAGVPIRPVVTMPQILQRDASTFMTALQVLQATIDPSGQNVPLLRFILTQALSSIGERDPASIVEKVFPDGYEPPQPMMSGMGGPPGEQVEQPPVPPGGASPERETAYPGARTAASAASANGMNF